MTRVKIGALAVLALLAVPRPAVAQDAQEADVTTEVDITVGRQDLHSAERFENASGNAALSERPWPAIA